MHVEYIESHSAQRPTVLLDYQIDLVFKTSPATYAFHVTAVGFGLQYAVHCAFRHDPGRRFTTGSLFFVDLDG